MKTFIKILGPPVLETIGVLENLAVHLDDICIMNTIILRDLSPVLTREFGARGTSAQHEKSVLSQGWVSSFFQSLGVLVPIERCETLISMSAESLGEHDFFFEWIKNPNIEQMQMLIEKIDEALNGLGCFYTLTTKV